MVTGDGIGVEDGGVAAVAHGYGVSADVQAVGVAGFLVRDGEEDGGDAAGEPLHQEAGEPARRIARGVEPEAVAGAGDARHASPPGGHPRQEAADRHVGVNEVRLFLAEQADQGAERVPMGQRRHAPLERDGDDPESLGAGDVEIGAVGAGSDDLMAAGANLPHQRQQELPQGEIDVCHFDDLHAAREYRGCGAHRHAGNQ